MSLVHTWNATMSSNDRWCDLKKKEFSFRRFVKCHDKSIGFFFNCKHALYIFSLNFSYLLYPQILLHITRQSKLVVNMMCILWNIYGCVQFGLLSIFREDAMDGAVKTISITCTRHLNNNFQIPHAPLWI